MFGKELETLDISYANHLLGDAADTRTAKLMRLSDLFDWVHDLTRRIILEIEYKASGMMPELCRLLQAFDKRNDCVIFASDPALIAEIQQYVNTYGVPEGVKLGANIGRLTPEWGKNGFHKCSYLKLDWISTPWNARILHGCVHAI